MFGHAQYLSKKSRKFRTCAKFAVFWASVNGETKNRDFKNRGFNKCKWAFWFVFMPTEEESEKSVEEASHQEEKKEEVKVKAEKEEDHPPICKFGTILGHWPFVQYTGINRGGGGGGGSIFIL